MADLFRSFVDFRPRCTSYKLHVLLSSKHLSSTHVYSPSSRIHRVNRRPFLLTLFCCSSAPTPSSVNIVSTHERSDGTLVFRFGELGEPTSSVQMEEPNVEKKEIEREGVGDHLVVNVLNGDNDGDVKDSSLTEVTDESNSIVTDSKNISVGEKENDLDEKLMKGTTEFELPTAVSSVDLKGSSTHGIDVEDTGGNQEYLNDEREISSMKSVSPSFDVISTHEHSDGSLIFRFGDLSMAASNAQLEESKVEKEIEKEDTDEDCTVTVLNGGDDGRVSDSSLAKVTDESNSIVIDGKNLSVSEKENNLGEKSKDTNELELPSTVSDVELKNPTPGIDIENGDDDECASDTSLAEVTDESNSIVIDVKNLSISEKENDLSEKSKDAHEYELPTIVSDVELKNSSTPGNDIENDESDEECLNEERDGSSVMSVPMLAKSSHIESNIAAVETPVKNIVDVAMLEAISLSPDTLTESEKDAFQSSTDTVVSTELSADTEIDDSIATMAPGVEAALQLSIDVEAQTSLEGNVLGNEIAEDGSDEESVSDDGEEDTDKSKSLKLDDIPQKSILVSESTEDDDNVNVYMVKSVMEMEPTEVASKSQEIQMTDFVLSSGAALLPHPSKVLTGGEDAYFVSGQTWLGVADGVGQWSFEGTNPGVYAQELIKNCEKLVLDCNSYSICDPVELLKLSVGETRSPGSSTVLLAQLVGQVLQVANIGDSGFIILRHGSVYKRSSPMLHVFNFPLQVERGDYPSNLAEFYRIDLEEEDVIILASDGLLDNLYDQEIASEVSKYLAADSKPEEIAEALAAKAQEVGKSTSARSPFADNAQAAGYAGYTGGKLDDVTVIVSVVQRQSSSQAL